MLKNAKSNVLKILQARYIQNKDKIAIGIKEQYGWREYSYEGLSNLSKNIASYLINDLKIQKNENIAIISKSRIEFMAVFFASIISGSTLIPISPNQELYNVQRYIKKYNIKYIFISQNDLCKAKEIQDYYKNIKFILLNDIKNNDYSSIYDFKNQETKFKQRALNSNAIISTDDPIFEEKTNFKNLLFKVNELEHEIKNKFKITKNSNILSLISPNNMDGLILNGATFLNMGWSIFCLDDINAKEIYSAVKDKKIKYIYTTTQNAQILLTEIIKDLKCVALHKKMLFNISYYIFANIIPSRILRRFMFKKLYQKTGLTLKGIIIYNNTNENTNKIKHSFRKLGLRACVKKRDY